MPITQAQLAQKLGVSQVSVSLAFKSGHNRLNEKTRSQILEAAQKYGYRPNASARVMRQGRFGSIGLLHSAHAKRSYLPVPMLDAIYEALEDRKQNLTFCRATDEQLADPANLPKMLSESHSDGLLVNIAKQIPQTLCELLKRSKLPAVWLNVKQDEDCVRADDFAAAATLTEHLLSLGHRRILHINASYDASDTHYSGDLRQQGYEHAMRQAGLKPRCLTGQKIPGDALLQTALQVLDSPDRPTGIVHYGDGSAVAFLQAAERLGLQLAKDLSLALLSCNSPESYHGMLLTHMQHDHQAVAKAAVDMLLEKIATTPSRRKPLPSVTVPMTMYHGRSCGRLVK
ncbi:MAG: LacI family DNA-binding transcriptional regulator [Phycisphaeraceae bacterium JB051]